MSMSVKFDGVELNEILDVIQGFTPFGGADLSASYVDMDTGGSRYSHTTRNMKVIDMPFIMRNDARGTQLEKYDLLQMVLNVTEPRPLEFGAMPNRIFYAMPNGDLSYDETVFEGKGSVQWIVGDGLGHAKLAIPYALEANEDGLYSAELMNNGTEWATVNYTIKNPEYENGYVGIASEYGAIQLGLLEEKDTETAKKSVILTKNQDDDFANWTKGLTNYQDSNKDCSGTLGTTSDFGGWLGPLTNLSNPNNKNYYGALREHVFTTKPKDWYIWARAWFETGSMGQTASWTLTMIDTNKKVIAGMTIDKADRTGNTACVTFFTGDGNGGTKVMKKFSFTPVSGVTKNPYSNEGRLKNRNMFDLRKQGNKVRFFFSGQYYEYPVHANVAAAVAERCQFWLGQYKGRNATTQRVTRLGITDVTIQQINVEYERDVPNRYPAGSVIDINGDDKRSYFNGQVRLGDEIKGTKYFKIPPGKTTTIQANVSTWCRPLPTITAYVNEVYR